MKIEGGKMYSLKINPRIIEDELVYFVYDETTPVIRYDQAGRFNQPLPKEYNPNDFGGLFNPYILDFLEMQQMIEEMDAFKGFIWPEPEGNHIKDYVIGIEE
jgi:hypothetical protein